MLEGSQNMTCTVLFSRFDQLRVNILRLLVVKIMGIMILRVCFIQLFMFRRYDGRYGDGNAYTCCMNVFSHLHIVKSYSLCSTLSVYLTNISSITFNFKMPKHYTSEL